MKGHDNMKVSQAATMLNDKLIPEFIGEELVMNEDLSNFADFGRKFTEMATANDYERFHKKIADKVGKQIWVARAYDLDTMNILRDGSEWGSVVEKTRFIPNEFETNFVWNLTAGQKYDDFLTFRPMDVSVKYWNSKVTYKVSIDKPYNQVKSAMISADSFMKYINAMEVQIQNKKKIGFKLLTERLHTAMVAHRLGQNKQIDLLTEYNTKFAPATALTPEKAFYDEDFIRYAIARISDVSNLMKELSVLYNDGSAAVFTPKSMQTLALNSLFSANIDTYLKANTYHPEFINDVKREEIPFWQGSGTTMGATLEQRTKVDTTIYDKQILEGETTVSRSWILGTLRDRDSIAIFNNDEYALSFQNPDTGVTKTNYMTDLSLFADTSENFVVFTLGNGS